MIDFIAEFVFMLTFTWGCWAMIAYAARKPFSDLYRDPLMWVLLITSTLVMMWFHATY